MTPIEVIRIIKAPIAVVFSTVSDIRQFSQALPHVTHYEFTSVVNSGVGAKFRETRLMNGKEYITELEITEFVENERVRIIADSHGTIWDTVFSLADERGHTLLTGKMEAKTDKLLPRLVNPLIRGKIAKAFEEDMNLVKTYCEGRQRG